MAQPQKPEDAANLIDALASKQLGPAGPQEGAIPQPSPQAGEPTGETPPAPEETNQGKAAEQGSPETEGDKVVEEAIVYDVDWGEGQEKRQLTANQIKSTFDRYSAMNFKNAQYKPVNDVIEAVMRDNPGMNPQQLAKEMTALYKAAQSNPTLGNTTGEKSGDSQEKTPSNLDGLLKKWSDDNAIELPPGYKDILVSGVSEVDQIKAELGRTQQMLRQVMAQGQGIADAAKNASQQGQQDKVSAARQQIANNLDRVQGHLGLQDDKAQDFMLFAAERGYTMEDFIDGNLTLKVMSDFKNNMDGPEMDRMREIAKRRQAYTGSMGSSPTAQGTEPQGESTFDKFAAGKMAQKGIS